MGVFFCPGTGKAERIQGIQEDIVKSKEQTVSNHFNRKTALRQRKSFMLLSENQIRYNHIVK